MQRGKSTKSFVTITLSILLFMLAKATTVSAENIISVMNTDYIDSAQYVPELDAHIILTSLSHTGNYAYLTVDPKQTTGPYGTVNIKLVSQGVTIGRSLFQNETKCYYAPTLEESQVGGSIGGSSIRDAILSLDDMIEIPLTPGQGQQTLTGEFMVNAPGSYTFYAVLNDGQTRVDGSSTVTFHLKGKADDPETVSIKNEKTISLDSFLEWEGTHLSIQEVDTLASLGSAEIKSLANKSDSLIIKGVRAGEVKFKVRVIGDGWSETIPLTIQVVDNSNPIIRFFVSIIEGVSAIFQNSKTGAIPLVVLLVALLACFGGLLYINFFRRIRGAFYIRCECGATHFHIEMKSPWGRSITRYNLLNEMLKQHEDHDAEVIKGIASDNDNRRNLEKIRIYIVKGSDRKPHYAFLKAGSNEYIDDIAKQIYPDTGRPNAKLKVYLSFIEQHSNKTHSVTVSSSK